MSGAPADGSERKSRPKLELTRRVGSCRDLTEAGSRRPPGISSGHIRRCKLRPVGDVIRRNIKAEVPRFAQFDILGECEIQIVGSHRADMIKISWRIPRNELAGRHCEAVACEPLRYRMWRPLAGIAGYIGPLIEVDICRSYNRRRDGNTAAQVEDPVGGPVTQDGIRYSV